MKYIAILITIIFALTATTANAGFFVPTSHGSEITTAIAHPINHIPGHEHTKAKKAKSKSEWENTTSFVLGLVGILLFFPGPFAILFGILGLAKRKKNTGFAIVGIVLGTIESLFLTAVILLSI